jgi:nicotinate phosphoribosyltransferase
VYDEPDLREIKARVQKQLAQVNPGAKRLLNPHEYPVGLETGLFELKTALVLKNRPIAA